MTFYTSSGEQPVFQSLSPDIHNTTQGLGRVITTAYNSSMTPVSYKIHLILDSVSGRRVFIRDKHNNMEGWHIVWPHDRVMFTPCCAHPTHN